MDLARDSNGEVDLARLEATVTVADMAKWIDLRLKDHDAYWPINRRDLEARHQIFCDLWGRSKADSRIRICIGQACDKLLHLALRWQPTDDVVSVRELLTLVGLILPSECWPVLREVVERWGFPSGWVEANLDWHWLEAAAAFPCSAEPHLWLSWLGNPRYGGTAYGALSHKIDYGVGYLQYYYNVLPAPTREICIEQAISRLLEQGREETLNKLRSYREHLVNAPVWPLVEASLARLGESL